MFNGDVANLDADAEILVGMIYEYLVIMVHEYMTIHASHNFQGVCPLPTKIQPLQLIGTIPICKEKHPPSEDVQVTNLHQVL